MNCPRCADSELKREPIEKTAVERCPTCHGIWLNANELEKLLDANPKKLLAADRDAEATPRESDQPLCCPRCQGARLIKLNSRLRPGTILDSCTVCFGTWLDAGELTRLAGTDLLGRLRRLFLG